MKTGNLCNLAGEIIRTATRGFFCDEKISHTIFLLIGICSFGYFIGGRNFAELNVDVFFLDFPIFVGEILLGACLALVLMKNKNMRVVDIRWSALIFYLSFIIVKALDGYSQWGALAFRHSALFYYPLFLFVGRAAFNRSFFNDCTNSILVFLMLLTPRFTVPFRSHSFVIVMLMVILIMTLSSKKLKLILTPAVIFLFSYQNILYVSRTELVGIGISSFLVVILFLIILRTKRFVKVLFFILYFASIVIFFFSFKQKANVVSLFKFAEMKERYKQQVQLRDDRAVAFKPVEYNTVQLYYEENRRKMEYKDSVEAEKLRLLLEKETTGSADDVGVVRQLREENRREIKVTNGGGGQLVRSISRSSRRENVPEERVPVMNGSEAVGGHAEEFIQTLSADRVRRIVENKDGMLLDMKKDIINKLDGRYHFDEKLKKGLLDGGLESRKTLTMHLNQVHHLDTLEERMSLMEILLEELGLKSDIEKNILISEIIVVPYQRSINHAIDNSLLRVHLWEDVIKDLVQNKPLMGFDFGKPFRSRNFEILGLAMGEWMRDGWVAMHNSYLDIVYRGGIVGMICVFSLFSLVITLVKQFIVKASMPGIFLSGAIVYWLVMANFGEILEMPYHAIPFWSLLGMTTAYNQQLKAREKNVLGK